MRTREKDDIIDYIALGERISRARRKIGATQEVFSEQMGITIQYLSAIENGRKKPSLQLVTDIAATTHTSIDELLFDTVPTPYAGPTKEMSEILATCDPAQARFLLKMVKDLREEMKNLSKEKK